MMMMNAPVLTLKHHRLSAISLLLIIRSVQGYHIISENIPLSRLNQSLSLSLSPPTSPPTSSYIHQPFPWSFLQTAAPPPPSHLHGLRAALESFGFPHISSQNAPPSPPQLHTANSPQHHQKTHLSIRASEY